MSGEGLTSRVTQRLSDLGRTKRFRIAVASVFSLVILAVAGVCYREAARLDDLLFRIPQIIEKLDLKAGDLAAKQLAEQGTLTVDGVEVGDRLTQRR